jgi:glutathione peroxidase
MGNLHEYVATGINGEPVALSNFEDDVVLVVNVASRCGLTPQYDGLVRLYDEYRGQGFEILAFPCNQFMGQEPGSEAEIRIFCTEEYGVEFPLFSKVDVNGDQRAPLYGWLTGEAVGPAESGDVTWNFEKFLIDRAGRVQARFAPQVEPCAAEVKAAIEAALAR